jgi:hypothetical protein
MSKTNVPDPLAEIEAALEVEVTDWEPTEVGDQVIGYVREISYVETKNGGRVGQVLIETKGGSRVSIWAGRTRLRKELARAKVQPGDALGVRYLGQVESKNGGNAYFDYKVQVFRVGPRRAGEMFTEEQDLGLVAGATEAQDDIWSQPLSKDEAGF